MDLARRGRKEASSGEALRQEEEQVHSHGGPKKEHWTASRASESLHRSSHT